MNWKLFLQSMSEIEFEVLEKEIWDEKGRRAILSMKDAPAPTEEEINLVNSGEFVRAIKSYRDRNNCSIMQAKVFLQQFRR